MDERSGRTGTLILALAASAAFIAATVVFANATSVERVTDHAEELHHTNAVLGTAALARAAAGQAVLFSDLAERGLASAEDAEVARRELAATTEALVDLRPGFPLPIDDLLAALTADPLDLDRIENEYRPAAAALRERIAVKETEIEHSEEFSRYVAAAVRVLVILVVPAAAILVHRRRTVEQVRRERLRMESQIEAEREISRAKDRFVAGMSHEIRTPLTGICGFTDILLDSDDGSIDRESLVVIHTEAAELSRMVDDFIATSRLDGGTLEVAAEEADLTEVTGAVVRRFERAGVAVTVRGTAAAVCDPGRVRHILTNLVSNAARHGGPRIQVEMEEDAGRALCRVIDDGAGVAADMEGRLFTRFVHDGDEALTTGTVGLGTWVARELARAMGGDVSYEREGELSIFALTLPAARAADPAPDRPAEVGATV